MTWWLVDCLAYRVAVALKRRLKSKIEIIDNNKRKKKTHIHQNNNKLDGKRITATYRYNIILGIRRKRTKQTKFSRFRWIRTKFINALESSLHQLTVCESTYVVSVQHQHLIFVVFLLLDYQINIINVHIIPFALRSYYNKPFYWC